MDQHKREKLLGAAVSEGLHNFVGFNSKVLTGEYLRTISYGSGRGRVITMKYAHSLHNKYSSEVKILPWPYRTWRKHILALSSLPVSSKWRKQSAELRALRK